MSCFLLSCSILLYFRAQMKKVMLTVLKGTFVLKKNRKIYRRLFFVITVCSPSKFVWFKSLENVITLQLLVSPIGRCLKSRLTLCTYSCWCRNKTCLDLHAEVFDNNTQDTCLPISLWWPIHIINPVDKTKLSFNTPH